jgi:small subunit ribosomal protein S18
MTEESTSKSPASSRTPLDFTALDAPLMARYVTSTGKILPRKYTGLTAKQQRHVARTIKQSRNLLLMK